MSKVYKESGVDIKAGYEAVSRMKSHVKTTLRKEVLGGLGGFGAAFDLSQLNMKKPVLVSGTDGVGTKLKLAIEHNKHNTIGIDAVAMCVNDILTTGAEPLYFLDYIATNKVNPEVIEKIVEGVSIGCKETNCALIGGETAEMGEMYHAGEYDIAGFAVGAVEKDQYIDGADVAAGDIVIGIASSGIHSNGYSLVRKLIQKSDINLNDKFDKNKTYLETFLEPTKLYVKSVLDVLENIKVKGMSHITGGGFIENIPRVIPNTKDVIIDTKSYETPAIFKWLQEQGEIDYKEMFNIFNMGIGYILVVEEKDKAQALSILKMHGEDAYEIGHVINGSGNVVLEGVES